jgi:hypothetical protein
LPSPKSCVMMRHWKLCQHLGAEATKKLYSLSAWKIWPLPVRSKLSFRSKKMIEMKVTLYISTNESKKLPLFCCLKNTVYCKYIRRVCSLGANPTTSIYSASVIIFYNAKSSLACFKNWFFCSTLKNALAYYYAGAVAVNSKVVGLAAGF